jgi:hypothetical protein
MRLKPPWARVEPPGGGPVTEAPPPPAGSGSAERVIGNSAFNLVIQAFQSMIYLVVFIVLARGLTTEDLGRYYFFFGLTLAVQLVVEGGIGTVLTYRIVKDPAEWRRNVSEAVVLFLAISGATAAVFLVIRPHRRRPPCSALLGRGRRRMRLPAATAVLHRCLPGLRAVRL